MISIKINEDLRSILKKLNWLKFNKFNEYMYDIYPIYFSPASYSTGVKYT